MAARRIRRKKGSQESREQSIVEQIIKRGEGGGGGSDYSWNEGSLIKFPPEPEDRKLFRQNLIFRVLHPKYFEVWIHFFTNVDDRTRVERCHADKGLPKAERRPCPLCARAKQLERDGKKLRAALMNRGVKFLWNAIPLGKDQDKFWEDEDGTKRSRVLQLTWTSFQKLGMILGDCPDAISREDGRALKLIKTVKLQGQGRRQRKQVSYDLQALKKRPLREAEEGLELTDLSSLYMLRSDEDLSEEMGWDVKRFLLGDEEGDEVDNDESDFDIDDEDEDDEF